MRLGNKFTILLAILFAVCFHQSTAIRGTKNGVRRRNHGSIVFGERVDKQRRITQWKGAAKSFDTKAPERAHKTRDEGYSKDEVEEIPTIEGLTSFATSTEKKHARSKEPKHKKGGDKVNDEGVSVIDMECDDPSDPRCAECDDLSNPLCNADTKTKKKIPGDVVPAISDHSTTTSLPSLAQTVQRVIPPFKISYAMSTELGENDIDDGDYAELAETTELYLTVYFTEYFVTEPADFHEVNVIVQKTDEPLTIRFFISTSFVVPGDVPTMQTMFDRLTDSFSGARARNYALSLNGMGSENPLRNVRSIALVNETPVEATDEEDSIFNAQTKVQKKSRFFASVVVGIVLVSLFTLLMVVARRRKQINEVQLHQRLQLDDVGRQDMKATGYLDSIRRQYRDDDESKTEIFNGEEEEDDAMTQSTDNRQALTELREAMSALESVVSHDAESSEGLSRIPLSNTDENGSHRKNAEYLNYLDLQASFDEEDLRT